VGRPIPLIDADRLHWERITDDLVRLKDTSEMMIDLAYSSLLLNSHHLAEEVRLLEEQIDKLHVEFQLKVLSDTEKNADPRDLIGLIRMGSVAERIADAASEIAEVVLRGIEPHTILQMVIQDAEETVERVIVARDSKVVDKTLRDARISEKTGWWVLVIRRGTSWMRPSPSTKIKAGDVIIASGYAEGEEDLKRLLTDRTEIK
jgi:uncharacterized protein with PhoU and TrkA domain